MLVGGELAPALQDFAALSDATTDCSPGTSVPADNVWYPAVISLCRSYQEHVRCCDLQGMAGLLARLQRSGPFFGWASLAAALCELAVGGCQVLLALVGPRVQLGPDATDGKLGDCCHSLILRSPLMSRSIRQITLFTCAAPSRDAAQDASRYTFENDARDLSRAQGIPSLPQLIAANLPQHTPECDISHAFAMDQREGVEGNLQVQRILFHREGLQPRVQWQRGWCLLCLA